ncbi:MAG: hypothetical protein HUJ54_09405 [Erysipelotrichaceae bacterium]|nr:hypothetical protein [Erysipelotrichaceae bacterium]
MKWLVWLPLAGAAAAGLFILNMVRSDPLAEGKAFLRAQESKDMQEITARLDKRRMDDFTEAVQDGSVDVFSMFHDYAFLGDSRVVGFSTYGYLDDARVFAGAGHTIRNVDDYLENLKSLQPSVVYLSYGVNDTGLNIGGGEGEGGYGAVYEAQIDKILDVVPNAKIVVNSIIAPSTEAVARSPRWAAYTDFNEQLKAMCEKRGWTYVDNDALGDGGTAQIYQADGVHFLSQFYYVWGQNILDAEMKADSKSNSKTDTKSENKTDSNSDNKGNA